MKRRWRLTVLVAVLVTLYVAARASGVQEYLAPENIRAMMAETGAWGFAAFMVVFCLGELVHIPGVVFLAGAVLAYGKLWGAITGIVGGAAACVVTFVVVRKVGGQPLAEIQHPFFRRMLDRLDDRPIVAMVGLRLFLMALPPVNYALAMSSVGLRDYAIAALLGLVVPFSLIAIFFDWAIAHLL